jgi:hypothetical protein
MRGRAGKVDRMRAFPFKSTTVYVCDMQQGLMAPKLVPLAAAQRNDCSQRGMLMRQG